MLKNIKKEGGNSKPNTHQNWNQALTQTAVYQRKDLNKISEDLSDTLHLNVSANSMKPIPFVAVAPLAFRSPSLKHFSIRLRNSQIWKTQR